MIFKQVNRDSLGQFRKEFNADLKTLGEKYGIIFSMGNIRFTDREFHGKLSAVLPTELNGQGQVNLQDIEKANWTLNCRLIGLTPEDFGKIFMLNGVEYKIIGLKTNNRRFPIIASRIPDGKCFKFGDDTVKLVIHTVKVF